MGQTTSWFQAPKLNILESLCSELIVEIFSHLEIRDLSQVALVCKDFKELAYTKRLWKNVTFRYIFSGTAEDLVVQSLVQKGIRHLNLVPNKRDVQLPNFQNFLPEVEYLYLDLLYFDGSTSSLDLLYDITKGVAFVAVLHLSFQSHCFGRNNVNAKLEEFLEQFPNVETLAWCWNSKWYHPMSNWEVQISMELKTVFKKFVKLKKLAFSFPTLTVPFPDVQFYHCTTLEHLTLHCIECSEITLRAIGQCYPNLLGLQLVFCKYSGGDFGEDCQKYLGHLQKLTFKNCENIQDGDVDGMNQWAEHIKLEYLFTD